MINKLLIDQGINCKVYQNIQTSSENIEKIDLYIASRKRKLQKQDFYIREKINHVENKREKEFAMKD